jgi:polysaccharide deacetylase family protein (PEP-CTERM system associated)
MTIGTKRHIVTVLLHDYYHRCVFSKVIGRRQWHRLASRIEQNVERVRALLAACDVKATFFTLGWLAEQRPELIQRLVADGHEIASAGYVPQDVRQLSPQAFREDLERAHHALEAAGAGQVIGYRCPLGWLSSADRWVLDVLIDAGYRYDASMRPPLWSLRDNQRQRRLHLYQNEKGSLWELPPPTARLFGFNIPIAGGNYLRQLPRWFMLRGYQRWTFEGDGPFVLYFHPWELDGELPRINNMGLLAQIRQYRNLGRMAEQLQTYLRNAEFMSVSQYLGLEVAPASEESRLATQTPVCARSATPPEQKGGKKVTLVIPCYNEKNSLPYLAHALADLERAAQGRYHFHYVFVDDASSDGTADELVRMFGERQECRILRHERNQGVAAAIQTGLRAATTEIVCSIDADCTYDPLDLLEMIPLLVDGVDVVVASPYHRQGSVINVPRWRLLLSKHLSKGYHLVFHNKLATYSSCCRVYRRSVVAPYRLEHGNFIGIVELLAELDSAGGKIVEFPAVLHSRLLGYSKMKVARTIWGHLRLLMRLSWRRVRSSWHGRHEGKAALVPEPPRTRRTCENVLLRAATVTTSSRA